MRKPRVLLIDMTKVGDATATGELKSALFADWPQSRLMQLHIGAGGKLGAYSFGRTKLFADADTATIAAIEHLATQFDPEVVLYRPTPKTPALHNAAMHLIDKLQKPLVTWIMDDWPVAFADEDPSAAAALEKDWRTLLSRSSVRLAISDAMSTAFQARYGLPFVPVANGVDPNDWPEKKRDTGGALKVRYAGSLAENMTLSSIVTVAQAVERLASRGINVRFEIKTRALWQRLIAPHLKGLKRTHIVVADLEPDEYRAWLAGADVSVIAYNFDKKSRSYIQYSLANKLPECLASGAPLVAFGPPDVATIAVLEKHDIGVRVTEDSVDAVSDTLESLATNPDQRRTLGDKARQIAFRDFSIFSARETLTRVLSSASSQPAMNANPPDEEAREAGAHVDETAVIARLLSSRRGRKHVMIDVGAHVGTSAGYFHELDWTIHCFEPDPENRAQLERRFAHAQAVSIDARAVSDKPQRDVAFFTSPESTGISGLSAFQETHKETGRVDITTLTEIVRERGISSIDFLKIDVEGFDLSVLKGAPWDALRPDVIECEFEDAKTKPMGHDWRDIAQYLTGKGYAVYVSEWRPIIRYGIPHDWRRIVQFTETTEIPTNAWGNLLAFADDPGLNSVQAAFSALVKRRSSESVTAASMNSKGNAGSGPLRAAQSSLADKRPFYADFGEGLRLRSPRLFALARLTKRAIGGMWRRWFLIAPAALMFGAVFLIGLAQPDLQARIFISGAAILAGIVTLVLYLGFWTYQRIRTLSMEAAATRAALTRQIGEYKRLDALVRRESTRLGGQLDLNIAHVDDQISKLTSQTNTLLSEIRARAQSTLDIEDVAAEIDDGLRSLETDLDAATGERASLRQRVVDLEEKAAALETAMRDMDTLEEQLSGLASAEQKWKNSESNLSALQEKFDELSRYNDEQAARLNGAFAHVKAARQRLKSLSDKS